MVTEFQIKVNDFAVISFITIENIDSNSYQIYHKDTINWLPYA